MSRGKRKRRENSRKKENSRLTFRKKSRGLGLFPTSDFDGVCTQNQCLLSADFVFQELRRTHIPLLVVYKCALAIASGKIKLIHSEKISSELKKVCTYVPYEALTSVYLVRTYIPFSLGMKNFYSLSGKKNNRPIVKVFS